MTSRENETSSDITVKALAMGAMDCVRKPEIGGTQASRDDIVRIVTALIHLFVTRRYLRSTKVASSSDSSFTGERVANQSTARRPRGKAVTPMFAGGNSAVFRPRRCRIDAVVIGASTGGPTALRQVIPYLPADLGVPVFIVQHMPPVFTEELATSLAEKSKIAVKEAFANEFVQANMVYVAPGGRHMTVGRYGNPRSGERSMRIVLNDDPLVNRCRPSVDVLFRSAAAQYGRNTLSVIMTGMGHDGCEGVRALKTQGAISLTQSEETCVVYGMPQAVDLAGLSDESQPLSNLASRISSIVRESQLCQA